MQECLKTAGVPESNGQLRLFSVTMDPQGQCEFHNRPYLAMSDTDSGCADAERLNLSDFDEYLDCQWDLLYRVEIRSGNNILTEMFIQCSKQDTF